MKQHLLLFILFVQVSLFCQGQSSIFPSQSVRQSPDAPSYPQRMDVVISFPENSSNLDLKDIDLLDSVYRITFADNNYFLYKVSITGYDDGKVLDETNNTLAQDRVDVIYNYFKNRCKSDFLIRIAPNKIYNSCTGEAEEKVRYQVPTDVNWHQINNLPEKDKKFRNIPLAGKVLMTFINDREACIGLDNSCYVPPRDMKVNAAEASIALLRGAFLRIDNSRAECPENLVFTLEEHLDQKEILEKYSLIPHEKQIIVQAGYLILESNYKSLPGECKEILPNGIKVQVPVSENQMESKLRMFAKSYSEKGVEYKGLSTRRVKSKTGNYLEAAISPAQIDTIFLGIRINADEVGDYFHKAEPNDYSVIKIKGKNYKPFKIGKNGDYVMKKKFEQLFNLKNDNLEMEEPVKDKKKKKRKDDDDEELD